MAISQLIISSTKSTETAFSTVQIFKKLQFVLGLGDHLALLAYRVSTNITISFWQIEA
jgi:hypothetical protein